MFFGRPAASRIVARPATIASACWPGPTVMAPANPFGGRPSATFSTIRARPLAPGLMNEGWCPIPWRPSRRLDQAELGQWRGALRQCRRGDGEGPDESPQHYAPAGVAPTAGSGYVTKLDYGTEGLCRAPPSSRSRGVSTPTSGDAAEARRRRRRRQRTVFNRRRQGVPGGRAEVTASAPLDGRVITKRSTELT
jgi:hypothetical protein